MQLDWAYTVTRRQAEIEQAREAGALLAIHEGMKADALRWRERGMRIADIRLAINRWHEMMIRRTFELSLAETERDGGPPPSPFCWLLLGSSGRGEQTLHTDQDNALVYLGGGLKRLDAEQEYFAQLARTAVTKLEQAGYPYCSGYVMATNPRWNLSLMQWRHQLDSYADYPSWDNTRYLLMAADMRPLFGSAELAAELRSWLLQNLRSRAFQHWQAADNGLSRPLALDFWGRFRLDQWGEHEGTISLKDGGYLPLVSSMRLWALAHGVDAVSTLQRIDGLAAEGIFEEKEAQEVRLAFHLLSDFRLWSNHLDPELLGEGERSLLKAALRTVKTLQKRTARMFPKPK
jgi:CBS domain-containing protein